MHYDDYSQINWLMFYLDWFKSQEIKTTFCKPINVQIDFTIDGWRPARGGSKIATIFLFFPEIIFLILGKQFSTHSLKMMYFSEFSSFSFSFKFYLINSHESKLLSTKIT